MTAVLSRIFDKLARLLAAKSGLDYREFLVRELFKDTRETRTGPPGDPLPDRHICELVIQKALDRVGAAEGSPMEGAGARQLSELVVERAFERTGGYRGAIGTDNEANRARWVEHALKSLPAGWRLLDAGAGEQQYRKHCDHLRYVSQDFAQYDGTGNETGLQTGKWEYGAIDIVSDICSIPEPDASFDAVMCTEVFEHVVDPIGAIREFARLLRPGGTLILTAPFACLTHFAPHFYYTGFSRFFYDSVLADNGFKNLSISASGGYFDSLAQELHRVPSIADRYATQELGAELKRNAWLLQQSLASCAAQDKGSSELLCYGLHVIAQRG